MRIDHFAYQQATRVAGFGLLLQLAVGIVLLVLGQVLEDMAMGAAALYVLPGIVVWAALIVVFHQHKLERLEALERSEIEAARVEGRGVFEQETVASDAAARRLGLVHSYLVPAASLIAAGLLMGLGIAALQRYATFDDPAEFLVGGSLGWQLAICVGLSLVSFIFSRFVAGMARQTAWQSLRGGAGFMVGTALVLLALAVGIVLQVFQQPRALEIVSQGIAWFMILAASEIVLNFILNLYRPRRPGEYPRPAFDSRVLGLLAAPDNIVRSINEAINYQFGFDITSSWGYQLLLRSFAALAVLGVVVLVLLSTVVVVGPGQQAVRLRGGRIVGELEQGTLLFKWPWPFETAEVVNVGLVRSLALGPTPLRPEKVNRWVAPQSPDPDRHPFIVAAPRLATEARRELGAGSAAAAALGAATVAVPPSMAAPLPPPADGIEAQFALIDADVIMTYRIRDGGLLDWLNFCNDTRMRRGQLDMRERALRAIAMRELSQFLSTQPLDAVLSPQGGSLGSALRERIQAAFDRDRTGVEVIAVIAPVLKPPGEAAEMYESISVETQNARKTLEEANRAVGTTMAMLVGDASQSASLVEAIQAFQKLRESKGDQDPAVIEARIELERRLTANPAQVSRELMQARAKGWQAHMEVRRAAEEVLGQAESYRAAPELYMQRRTMEVIGQILSNVRVKYVLGVDPSRVEMQFNMQSPDPGLNVREYLQRPDGK
ncbi:MAG: hypothetical protein FJ253_05575 [Phycisphaerae bacterium]|nr:hypothetical protein [Phycisphaerae bacterium]